MIRSSWGDRERPTGYVPVCLWYVYVCVHMRGFHSTYGGDGYGIKMRGDRDGKTKGRT